ncbi:MAG: 1-(5-phosphoribosyl)-5-[(5-phosphoribosylamino)methylideneamino]imidazole-4-carboxamide isomerase [Muribaculaceae bacterium]|jgi:phosphoribosylformimino-5-aminoimidazole carboxamide ribotide isomerase|nr:1-(5-phosphoribosyl)-5-[(5-phosphoribosylamino)methylideneamino]imidazole-4-carboxamide isomerase [Muribaculaceae bacterium]
MIEIIPAIDIINGKCVRLTKGDYSQQKTYADNPLDIAKMMEDAGCKRLHLVDLDGAKSQHIVNYKVIESIASATKLIIDFGGGIKSDEDLHIAFESGATMITGGSIAVKSPELFTSWIEKFGGDKIILGADVRNGKISTSGWLNDSELDIIPFIKDYQNKGITQVISTDINVDGMLSGPSIELYNRIMSEIENIYIIASGGVSKMSDIEALETNGVPAVIVGKAIYENRISIKELENHNLKRQ